RAAADHHRGADALRSVPAASPDPLCAVGAGPARHRRRGSRRAVPPVQALSRRGLAPSLRRADARTRRRAPTVSDTATPRRGTAIGPTARSAAGDAVDVEDAFDL